MIQDLFELHRDRETGSQSFGYTDELGFTWESKFDGLYNRPGDPAPLRTKTDDVIEIGAPLQQTTEATLPLAKSVEYYTSGPQRLVIERLYHNHNRRLIPYKIRYRYPRKSPSSGGSVVHLTNLGQIHQALGVGDSGRMEVQPVFKDPRKEFLDRVEQCPFTPDSSMERFADLRAEWRRNPMADLVCRHSMTAAPVQYDVGALSTYLTWGEVGTSTLLRHLKRTAPQAHADTFVHLFSPGNLKNLVNSHLVPEMTLCDPITHLFPVGGITTGELTGGLAHHRQVDTSVSPILPIREPEKTLRSPYSHRCVAGILDSLHATDVKVEYTSYRGAVQRIKVHHYIDRYADLLGSAVDDDLRLCDEAAAQAMLASSFIFGPDSDHLLEWGMQQLLHDAHPDLEETLIVEKTHNDEAMVSFYRGPRLVYAIHLDLAALSLCSIGVHEQV